MNTTASNILSCTCCTRPMRWGWSVTTVYGSYCRPECEAQHRAEVVVAQVRTLADTATLLERRVGMKDTYQQIVDLMIKIEDEYYDAGYDMELYALAKNLRGAK